MQIQLAFKRLFLAPAKTFAAPMMPGARVRVVDGMVWATTTGDPDDVWLGAGDEHTVQSRGLTVIESLAPSTIELIPPAHGERQSMQGSFRSGHLPDPAPLDRGITRFLAAVAMTVISVGLLVVLPAKIESGSWSAQPLVASKTDPSEAVDDERGAEKPMLQMITQESSSARSATRVQ